MRQREIERRFKCKDCKVNTGTIAEYYMVEDRVWKKAGNEAGMLCIGCLEDRLGRRLHTNDFSKCPLNFDPSWIKSDRLLNRMTNGSYPSED